MRKTISLIAGLLMLAGAADARAISLMPLKFLDTSKEAQDQKSDHDRRLGLMDQALSEKLAAGHQLSRITPEAVKAACAPETVACLVDLAGENGADTAIFVVVHKTSTLIMQVFTQVVDLKSQTVIYDRDVSFRGDTDESWTKAATFLGREIDKALGSGN